MDQSLPHRVDVDRANNLIVLTMRGVISPEDGAWMGEEVRAAVRSLGPAIGQHVTLYDFTEVPVVPQATLEQLRQTLVNPQVRQLWARKLAIVTSTALAKLQALEVKKVRPDVELFEDRAAALEWLLA